MFKCCVCNKSSKKSKKEKKSEESESFVDSNRIENVKNAVIETPEKEKEKINGDLKNIVENSLLNSPRESSDREKSDATSDPESTKKREESEDSKDCCESLKNCEGSPSGKSVADSLTKENFDLGGGNENETAIIMSKPKLGCLYTPAYIERTIVEGLDDGDDSVFEASGINETDLIGTPGILIFIRDKFEMGDFIRSALFDSFLRKKFSLDDFRQFCQFCQFENFNTIQNFLILNF